MVFILIFGQQKIALPKMKDDHRPRYHLASGYAPALICIQQCSSPITWLDSGAPTQTSACFSGMISPRARLTARTDRRLSENSAKDYLFPSANLCFITFLHYSTTVLKLQAYFFSICERSYNSFSGLSGSRRKRIPRPALALSPRTEKRAAMLWMHQIRK